MVLHRKVKRMDEDEVMPIIDLPDVDDPSEVPEQPEEQAKVVNTARKLEEIPNREAFQYVHGLHVGNASEVGTYHRVV